jgi:bifunctional non-homologous end joining protein LigD
MSLKEYKRKKAFDQTPEPEGGKSTDKEFRFVVQKHAASQLHYDFRLQVDGVLKCWAVPKGHSLDPAVKRLAMQTEDHPYDYLNFEGLIPEKNYGVGTMIIWDQGTYEPINKDENQQQKVKDALEAGALKISLIGKRLKG